jgi:hypothetical protein
LIDRENKFLSFGGVAKILQEFLTGWSDNDQFSSITEMPHLPATDLARIGTVTPQQAVAFAAARGVRVDSRIKLLKSF